VKIAKSLTGHSIPFFEKLFISGYPIYYLFQMSLFSSRSGKL